VAVGGMVAVAVSVGAADRVVESDSSAVIRRMSVAKVGVLLGVSVEIGVLVAVGVAVAVAVGVSVSVGVLVAVSVGNTAIVGSSAVETGLPRWNAKRTIPLPNMRQAAMPKIHFFTQSPPVSAPAYLSHGTETGAANGVILHRRGHQF
jgi:hypothetical protein